MIENCKMNCICATYCPYKLKRKNIDNRAKCMELRDKAYSDLEPQLRATLIDDGYQALAYAIIERAMIDIVDPGKLKDYAIDDDPKEFLHSEWCEVLSGVDKDIMSKIFRRYEHEKTKSKETQGLHKQGTTNTH